MPGPAQAKSFQIWQGQKIEKYENEPKFSILEPKSEIFEAQVSDIEEKSKIFNAKASKTEPQNSTIQ